MIPNHWNYAQQAQEAMNRTKPMIPTPRTDAEESPNHGDYYLSGMVSDEFARTLERENVVLREMMKNCTGWLDNKLDSVIEQRLKELEK